MSSSFYYSTKELAEVLERADSEVRRSFTSSSMSKSRTRGFPFMKLPPELRDKIYRLHLILPGRIKPTEPWDTSFVKKHYKNCMLTYHPRPSSGPQLSVRKRNCIVCTDPFTGIKQYLRVPESVLSILLVNRQINAEATYIFYRFNNFLFRNVHSLQFWLDNIGMRYVYLGELTFTFSSDGAIDVFLKLQNCPFLKKLHIDLRYNAPTVRLNKGGRLASATGMRELRKIRGIEVLNLVGQDRKEVAAVAGADRWEDIDIMDDAAVGPNLRRDLMTPRPPEVD